MIESKEAVDNIDKILSVDGVNGVFIGHCDITGSYGTIGQTDSPIIKAGKHIVIPTLENVKSAVQQGFTLLALGMDTVFLANGARQVLEMIKIAVTDLEYNKAVEVFKAAEGCECLCAPTPEAELAEFIKNNNVSHVIVGVNKYQDKLYDSLPEGGVIARFGVGHDGIDKELAVEKRLFCTNTPGVLDNSVTECAVSLILSAARHLTVCSADNKNHIWKNRVGIELSGKTLAVIGCGNIGRKVAGIAKSGFGMKVIGFDIIKPEDHNLIDEFTTDFAEAVKSADFVTVHIPDITATKDFINAKRLAQIPAKAVLVNTARGNIIDENALYDALVKRKLSGAALDVFKSEPYMPQHPDKDLRTLENVIMTPHIGSSTLEACERMAKCALQNIIHIINNKFEKVPLLNP